MFYLFVNIFSSFLEYSCYVSILFLLILINQRFGLIGARGGHMGRICEKRNLSDLWITLVHTCRSFAFLSFLRMCMAVESLCLDLFHLGILSWEAYTSVIIDYFSQLQAAWIYFLLWWFKKKLFFFFLKIRLDFRCKVT